MFPKLMPASTMRDLRAYNNACDRGYKPREEVQKQLEALNQDEAIIADVKQNAESGIAKLTSLAPNLKTCVQSSVAQDQKTHLAHSVKDLRELNAEDQKMLGEGEENLHNMVEQTKALKENVDQLKEVRKKQLEEGVFIPAAREMGNRMVHYVATGQQGSASMPQGRNRGDETAPRPPQ